MMIKGDLKIRFFIQYYTSKLALNSIIESTYSLLDIFCSKWPVEHAPEV
jgi:hypothetical protein